MVGKEARAVRKWEQQLEAEEAGAEGVGICERSVNVMQGCRGREVVVEAGGTVRKRRLTVEVG